MIETIDGLRRKELKLAVAKQWKLTRDRFGPVQKHKLSEAETAYVKMEFDRVFHCLWGDLDTE